MTQELTTIDGYNLPADIEGYDENIAEMMGMGSEDEFNTLPRLKINRDFDDDAGNELPPGTFHLALNGVDYFAKSVIFRPFVNRMRVEHWVEGDSGWGVSNRTIYVPDWSHEMIDESGGTRCGKLKAKNRGDYSDDQLKAMGDKDKKMFRYVWGTVRIPNAVNRKGEQVSLDEPTPVFLKLQGSNFVPFDDEVIKGIKRKGLLPNFEATCTLERKKNGATTYYIAHFAVDPSNRLPMTQDDVVLLRQFMDTIKYENDQVRTKFDKAIAKQSKVVDAEYAMSELSSDLEDDDIPF